MPDNPLHRLMNPGSIVTFGCGNNTFKMGTWHAMSILKDGYQGKFYPVHPKDQLVLGNTAYKTVFDLPEIPDLAFIVVPSNQVIRIMEDLGKFGTKSAIIITAGFKETGTDGQKMESTLKDIAAKYGMRFLGPNCMGIINSEISLNTTVMPYNFQKPGRLGLASQSGTYVTQSLPYILKKGIAFSKSVSVGNEANISITDVLEYLGEDSDTKAISLYIEGVRDVRRFIEVAQKVTKHKPVLAQYVGGSNAGARSGQSHTGAMAGPDHVYDGIFKQAGIIRMDSIEDLYLQGWAAAVLPPLKGNRIGVVTNSGGPGTAISHICEINGMEIPTFSEKLQQDLKKVIPPHAPAKNPVDITFDVDVIKLTTVLPELIMKSGEVDGIVLHGAMASGFFKAIFPHIKEIVGNLSLDDLLKSVKVDKQRSVKLPMMYSIPLSVSTFFDKDDSYVELYQENNIPVFDSPEKAARAMAVLNKAREIFSRGEMKSNILPDVSKEAAAIIRTALGNGQKALDEHQSKMLLNCYNIPVTAEELVRTEEDAVRFAESAGYPVVLKLCSHEVLHKTEKGLVFLDLKSKNEVIKSFKKIQKFDGKNNAALIYKMLKGGREFVAGMTRIEGIGPCIQFGLGGIYTEILKDTAFRIPPLSETEAAEMIFDIKARNLLKSFRGMPEADSKIMSKIMQSLGAISLLHPEIREIDMNPIIIDGSKPVAVDALIVLGE